MKKTMPKRSKKASHAIRRISNRVAVFALGFLLFSSVYVAAQQSGPDAGPIDLQAGLEPADSSSFAPAISSPSGTAVAPLGTSGPGGDAVEALLTVTSPGRTAGQFTVSPTGASIYNIPIWAPPGARDIEPHLALHYMSGGPDGIVGPGWSLKGISAITRCGKTWASNAGVVVGVTLSTSDDFCLDGQRLRITSGTQGVAGSTYQTEIADFSNVTAYSSSGSGPAYFIVQGKDGRYYEYGNTTDSRLFASGATTPYMWGLNKVRDRQGNNMAFTYNSGTALAISNIQYTATPATGASYGYEVLFTYAARTGGTTLSKYVAGGAVTQPDQLSKINVTSGGTSVRQYNLTYAASSTTTRPMLTSVQECGGTAGTDCLRPTNVAYQAGATGWSTTASSTGLTGQYGYLPIDLNGDGIPDAMYGKLSGSTVTWYARIATSTTAFGSEISTGATTAVGTGVNYTPNIIPGAFSGNGKMQFLAPVSGSWYVYSYNGSGFSAASTGLAIGFEQMATDYDGDGLPDLVAANVGYTSNITVRRNTTAPGGAVTFSTSTLVAGNGLVDAIGGNIHAGAVVPADFNGDGKADLLIGYLIPKGKSTVTSWTVLMSNGFGSVPTSIALPTGATIPASAATGDWNADGCTDVISPAAIWISNCAGGFTQLLTNVTNGTNENIQYLAVDWDGDGQTDLLYADFTNFVTGDWFLIRSTGTGLGAAVDLHISAKSKNFFAADQNSDGQLDLMYIDSVNGYAVGYYPHNGGNTPPDLANSITDGLGINFNPVYVSISQNNYTKGTGAVFPEEDLQLPMYVVSQFTASDGLGGTYLNQFWYWGARLHAQGRGFEGYSTTRVRDNRNGLYHTTSYRRDFPYIGEVSEDDVYQTDDATYMSRSVNSYNMISLAGTSCSLRCYPYVSAKTLYRYEVGGAKNGDLVESDTTNYTLDNYGNVTTTSVTQTDNDSASPASPFSGSSWTSIISNQITNDTANWCLGRPSVTTSQKTAAGEPALTRTVKHTIDYVNCRATAEVVEPGNTRLQVTTNFGFDGCGNTNSVSVIGLDQNGVSMPIRTTTMSFGTRCQLLESATNPLNQTSSTAYRYDLGLKSSMTDPNGITVSWLYDNFGRKTKETRPDSTATTWTFADCVSSSCWGVSDLRFLATEALLNSGGTVIRSMERFYDGLDRLRYSEGNRVLGVWDIQITTYDNLGRKTEDTLPYSSASNGYHKYTYDLASRPLSDALYSASGTLYRTTSLGYLGQTVSVTDPKLNVINKVSDIAGKLRQVTDPSPGGTTKYTYDSFENLTKIVDATNVTSTYSYNIRGFKTGSVDADTGTWTFTPDSLNELITQTDANGAVTSFTYDLVGRMITRLEPESPTATTWTYGTSAAAHNIGQVQSVAKPDGYGESHAFDSFGRPQTTVYAEDGVAYQFDYAFNTNGTVDTVTYPVSTSGVRFALKYVYDSTGYLNSVNDASVGTTFWTLTAANDNSAPTLEVLGNAVQVATSYTPWTNEMITRTEGSGGSTTNLQNLSYSWDLNGNMSQRQDLLHSLTEAFTPDALNRLTHVTLNNVATLTVAYDAAGNITSKSDVGTYTYGSTAHPHAVTAAGSWTIGYDANGNMNSRAGGSISSYSYNLPSAINYNGNSTDFSYDSSHQRWKQVANYSGSLETTHYIGGLLAIVTSGSVTQYRHQIPAGSSSVVYTRRTDGTTSTYYATSDHLGSADLVMDSGANVLVRESFTPFGARRGSNWQGIPTTADYTAITSSTRQGFTGHEMLDSVALVHMNGRVYDPFLGRFLSADTVIQTLGGSQSLNPYTYVGNDPLDHTDPSGEFCWGGWFGTSCGDSAPPSGGQLPEVVVSAKKQNPIIVAGVAAGAATSEIGVGELIWLGIGIYAATEGPKVLSGKTGQTSDAPAAGPPDPNDDNKNNNKDQTPASEKTAKDIAKRVEKDLGKDARRQFHDSKENGAGDRTLGQLKQDARDLYTEAGKEIPNWLK